MRKIVLLFAALLFLFNVASTQTLQVLPGWEKQFKKVQKPANNPGDQVRHRLQNSAQRKANPEIYIDYGIANGDDLFLANFMNLNFSPIDSTPANRYVLVAADSLHDAVTDIGYNFGDFDSIRIDSVWFGVGHENNSGLPDTLIAKIVRLNATTGYPTNVVLWADTFVSATSLTGTTNWNQIRYLQIAPGLTLPSTTKFGLRLDYQGAKQDTFAYLFSFVDNGACPGMQAPYSAEYSNFFPNSYRFSSFNNLLLPTNTNPIQDLFWDCDGNGSGETAPIEQNINFSALLTGLLPAQSNVRLISVDPVTDEVTIKNFGSVSENISNYQLCSEFLYTANLSSQILLGGSLNLAPDDTVRLRLTTLNLDDSGADLGLYVAAADFTDPNDMLDFTQWLSGGNGRESVAVAKGIWGAGDFVTGDAPYTYIGNGLQNGAAFWEGFLPPLTGCDTLMNVSLLDTPTIFVVQPPDTGYVSGHNSYRDRAKADFFENASAASVTGAIYFFGAAASAGPTGTVSAAVWNAAGANSSPGALLTSQPILINGIVNDVNNGLPTVVNFSTPATVTGDFYVGIILTYAAGDTVALYTTTGSSGAPNTAWEQWSNNAWFPYSSTSSWNRSRAHYILPVICAGAPCPTITANVTGTDATCLSATGSATVNVTGGSAPYSYSWSNGQTAATLNGVMPGTYNVTVTDSSGCTGVGTVMIGSVNNALSVTTISSPNTLCNGGNGAADASATGGTAPYSFVWSNGSTSSPVLGLASGTYGVTATDVNGCSGTASAIVNDSLPTVSVVVLGTPTPNTDCASPNGSATVTAFGGSGPYTFVWDSAANNQTAATAINLAGGNYVVTATDASGCTGTGNVTIVNNTPTITIVDSVNSPSTSCANPDGSITLSVNGGSGPYSFNWSDGQTGATATGLPGGPVSVTVTDINSCTGTATFNVNSTTPAINVVATSQAPNTQCTAPFNGAVTVSASNGQSPYNYLWSNGQTGAALVNLNAGDYILTVTDSNFCTAIDTFTIVDNTPNVDVSVVSTTPVTDCSTPNGAATVSTTGALGTVGYAWSSGGTASTENNLAAGTYVVTATDNQTGCFDTANIVISDNTAQISISFSGITPVTACDSDNGATTASPSGGATPYTYLWSDGQTAATATLLAEGTYFVTATDANGCSAVDSVVITDNRPTLSVTVTKTDVTQCDPENGTASATATGGATPYQFLWSNGATTPTASNLSPGAYTVTVTDQNGCEGTATVTIGSTVNPPQITVTATNESSSSANDGTVTATVTTGTGTAPFTYAWAGLGATTATLLALDAGTYTVTVTDAAGCTATGSATVSTNVGINDPQVLQSLSLFPNPASDQVNLKAEITEANDVTIEMFNVVGVEIFSKELKNVNSIDEKFNVSALPEGVYLLKVTLNSEAITKKITVVK